MGQYYKDSNGEKVPGLGEVIKVEGTGDNAKATIHFKNAGDKQLLLRFARFKVVE